MGGRLRCAVVAFAAAVAVLGRAASGQTVPPFGGDEALFGRGGSDRERRELNTPYDPDPEHLWNRLHRALFARQTPDGREIVHATDPFLFTQSRYLFEGPRHRRALELLDEFLDHGGAGKVSDPVKRLVLQRDLWAAFDWCAWVPDDWVHKSADESAAKALRRRLARAVAALAPSDEELAALPDNYLALVRTGRYATAPDPADPGRPFLPSDLFDKDGPWVAYTRAEWRKPEADVHVDAAGGRAAHLVFLRLPGGRKETEAYLKSASLKPLRQFPVGTTVAMVRRALAVDRHARVRATSLTETVQLRVYRSIPAGDNPNDRGDQDGIEFTMSRTELFKDGCGLSAVGVDAPFSSFFRTGVDPFEKAQRWDEQTARQERDYQARMGTALSNCLSCHQGPGVVSVISISRGLSEERAARRNPLYATTVEYGLEAAVRFKLNDYRWGLLQGYLERDR